MRKLYNVKQTYSIEDAAERLSLTLGEHVAPDEILQLMADGEIGIFWWMSNRLARPVAPMSVILDGESNILGPSRKLILHKAIGEVQGISGVFRICTETDMSSKKWARRKCTGGFDDPTYEGIILCDSCGAFWELMRYGDGSLGDEYSPNRMYLSWIDIIVTKSELDRFEGRFSGGDAVSRSNESENSLSDRERASFQKQLAVLALALAEKSGRYARGAEPNASQIAAASEEILDALPQVKRHGTSSTLIRQNIASGIQLLVGK